MPPLTSEAGGHAQTRPHRPLPRRRRRAAPLVYMRKVRTLSTERLGAEAANAGRKRCVSSRPTGTCGGVAVVPPTSAPTAPGSARSSLPRRWLSTHSITSRRRCGYVSERGRRPSILVPSTKLVRWCRRLFVAAGRSTRLGTCASSRPATGRARAVGVVLTGTSSSKASLRLMWSSFVRSLRVSGVGMSTPSRSTSTAASSARLVA